MNQAAEGCILSPDEIKRKKSRQSSLASYHRNKDRLKASRTPEELERRRLYKAAWMAANKDRVRASQKRWRQATPKYKWKPSKASKERRRAVGKRWMDKNRERLSEKRKSASNEVRQKRYAAHKKWVSKNREAVLAKKRAYSRARYARPEVKERIKAAVKDYRKNPEKQDMIRKSTKNRRSRPEVRAKSYAYEEKRRRRPEVKQRRKELRAVRNLRPEVKALNRIRKIERRARERNAVQGDRKIIVRWETAYRSRKRVSCYWCGGIFPSESCHTDHIHPLAKGGAHSIENLCISCRPCNQKKHDKTPEQWNQILTEPTLL